MNDIHNDVARHLIGVSDSMSAGVIKRASFHEGLGVPKLTYDFECFGPSINDQEEYLYLLQEAHRAEKSGFVIRATEIRIEMDRLTTRKWEEKSENLVTTQGKNDIIDKYFKGSSYTAAWFMLLVGTGTIAASDTLASHAGWTEQTPYSGNRPAITFGTTAGGSNTATGVSYSITGTATIAGAGICSVNTGTSGILYSASDFSSSRSVANGDTLIVTPTVAVA